MSLELKNFSQSELTWIINWRGMKKATLSAAQKLSFCLCGHGSVALLSLWESTCLHLLGVQWASCHSSVAAPSQSLSSEVVTMAWAFTPDVELLYVVVFLETFPLDWLRLSQIGISLRGSSCSGLSEQHRVQWLALPRRASISLLSLSCYFPINLSRP